MIACVRLPHFGPAIEQREHPTLAAEPFALTDAAGHITDVSYQAAQAGVQAGMAVPQAQALCAELHLLPASPTRYHREFEQLLAALTQFTEFVEPGDGLELRADARRRASVPFLPSAQVEAHPAATCYLDLGSLPDEEAGGLAEALHDVVQQQTGLSPAIALASGKFPARVAALLLDSGEVLVVPAGQEADFLARFAVMLLPVDGETLRQLHLLGLVTLGDVAALPVAAVVDRFGRLGRVMHRLARGRDTSPVQRYTPPLIEHMVHSFDDPVADWAVLHAVLGNLVSGIADRLQESGQVARQVTVELDLDDGSHPEHSLTLRRNGTLAGAVRDLAASLPITNGVVGITVTLDAIEPQPARQLSLFEREPVSAAQLRDVLHTLVDRYGEDCFFWARVADADARLPERRVRLEQVR